MQDDWSLNPNVRKLLQRVPLPISLPTPLRRGKGRTTAGELHGTRAVVTHLRDALDMALAQALQHAGAAMTVVDAAGETTLTGRIVDGGGQLVPSTPDLPAGILQAITQSGATGDRRPLTLIHRVTLPHGTDLAVNETTDALLAVGHAAAHLPGNSRLILVLGPDLQKSSLGALMIATAHGFMRSAFKELGKSGSTCHVIRAEDAQAAGALATFLASPRAAFLSGLDLLAQASAAGDASDGPQLDGKVVLVTGAARGIGASIADRLALEGAHVWINDIAASQASAADTVAQIRARGGQAEFIAADVGTLSGAQAIAEAIGKSAGRIDGVVHNAGITRDRTLRKMSVAHWRQVLQVNFGAMHLVQTAIAPIVQPGAAMVLMSSVMGIAGNFGQTNYSASKSAVIQLAKQWACEGHARGMRANAIAPGFILTDMTAQMPVLNREMAKQLTAMLQPGLPLDVAELACFLVGAQSRGVTGQVLRCDGGMAFGA
jgi:3-oxoacyl-[acyl-carrier protein] reductase